MGKTYYWKAAGGTKVKCSWPTRDRISGKSLLYSQPTGKDGTTIQDMFPYDTGKECIVGGPPIKHKNVLSSKEERAINAIRKVVLDHLNVDIRADLTLLERVKAMVFSANNHKYAFSK